MFAGFQQFFRIDICLVSVFRMEDFKRLVPESLLGICQRFFQAVKIIAGIHQPFIKTAADKNQFSDSLLWKLRLQQRYIPLIQEIGSRAQEKDGITKFQKLPRLQGPGNNWIIEPRRIDN